MAELKKIEEFIAKNNIKARDCLYHTNRSASNSKGEPKGQIRALVWKNDPKNARIEYQCPECGNYGYTETEWKRPLYTKCEKCSFKISVPKMRDAAKKEAKARK